MKRKLWPGLLVVFFLLFGTMVFAFFPSNYFNVDRAHKTLEQLSNKLTTQQLTLKQLQQAIGVLTELQKHAKNCVYNVQHEVDTINKLWGEPNILVSDKEGELTRAQKYLVSKRKQLIERRSMCRLFILHSNEIISAYRKKSHQLTTQKLLEVKPGFFTQIVYGTTQIRKAFTNYKLAIFLKNGGFKEITLFSASILVVFWLFGILSVVIVKVLLRRKIAAAGIETFTDKLRLVFLEACNKYIIPFVIFLILAIFAALLNLSLKKITYLSMISCGLCSYIVILALVHILFFPIRSEDSITGIAAKVAYPLIARLKILVNLLLLSFIVYVLWQGQVLPQLVVGLSRTIFITLLSVCLISILWLINRIPKLFAAHGVLRFLINLVLTCVLLAILMTEWLGYQILVTYILQGIILTLLSLFLTWVFSKIVSAIFQNFARGVNGWQHSLRQLLGLKRYKSLPEFVGLSVILYFLIWGGFIVILLKIWVLSAASFQKLTSYLLYGFKTAGIEIVPSRILSAFIFCIIVFLLIRLLRAGLERRAREDIEPGAQEALSAIITYIGVAITILIALIIAGVNFAGLAIIAGALSVGVGFGLQNVVSNFVAGIVLLIERPIKPGDRVIIGDVEGFVEKVRVLATQIKTLQFSDLIVPNSEMISKQVDNLMFRDFYHRVNVAVGVAYNSDIELVQKLLLDIAQEHPEVVKGEGPYQPKVLFKEFGTSALICKLYCVIRNVNLRYVVQSELNAMVHKVFAANGVTIAYPQQDIHIKEWPQKF